MNAERHRRVVGDVPAKGSSSPLLWIALFGGLLVLLVACAGVSLVGFLVLGGAPAADGPQALIAKADLDRVESGMTLDEVTKLLGPGRAATQAHMRTAFNENRLVPISATDNWTRNADIVGVSDWHQWQNGNESIFVGFGKGKRTGKDRALMSFWVKRLDKGFESSPGLLPLFRIDDPDAIVDGPAKLNDDPRFKGDVKKNLIGNWRDDANMGYAFRADGTYERLGRKYQGTYRFIAADQIELILPPGAEAVGGPELKEQYRVWAGAEDMILQPAGLQMRLEFKRK